MSVLCTHRDIIQPVIQGSQHIHCELSRKELPKKSVSFSINFLTNFTFGHTKWRQ